SPVARQAHNLKVIGSNPIPATNQSKAAKSMTQRLFAVQNIKAKLGNNRLSLSSSLGSITEARESQNKRLDPKRYPFSRLQAWHLKEQQSRGDPCIGLYLRP
ncbi:hypothetical protein, partial [Iodidimonas muriae]|uniref:hypothetical protein n=1 Tax=Iodidimonas muriae TaxID=261467 RepID=UPI001E4A7D92